MPNTFNLTLVDLGKGAHSVFESLLELAFVDGETISLNELALAMHPAIFPVAFVVRSIDILKLSISIYATFGKLTCILALV